MSISGGRTRESYKLSRRARADYFEAFDYIANHSPQAASEWEQRMLHTFDHLAEWPYTGRVRVEYAPSSYRFWVSGDYLILYSPKTNPVEIVTILHGAQDLTDIIGQSLFDYSEDVERG